MPFATGFDGDIMLSCGKATNQCFLCVNWKESPHEQRIATWLTVVAHELVTTANFAATLGSGDLLVYATPAMIALMEAAAMGAVAALLAPQQSTVGVHVDVRHLAATPLCRGCRPRRDWWR